MGREVMALARPQVCRFSQYTGLVSAMACVQVKQANTNAGLG
jgi:hypothetical protein